MDKSTIEYMDLQQKRVTKGERTRILYECFLEALGLSYESSFAEVVEKMRETQKEYHEAVNYFGEMMKMVHSTKTSDNETNIMGRFRDDEPKLEPLETSVSVSHN